MKVRMITPKTMDKFQYLIAPEVYADMEAGQPVTAIGLAEDKTPIGAVAGVMENEYVFSVRSLYVAPDYRRQGGATMLITALERLLDTRDALACISFLEDDTEDSRALIAFVESRDCVLENGLERLYRGTVGSFVESGLFSKGFRSKDIHSLVDVDKPMIATIGKRIRAVSKELGDKYLSSFRNDRRLSFAALKKEDLQGVLLTGYMPACPDEPLVVMTSSQDPHIIGGLLSTFFNSCRSKFGDTTYLRFPVVDDRFDRMMGHIDGVTNIQHNYLF
ncbi:MAG: GNAT family N-acetyltransferase [Lachnospiraceae bacterium]|nr:GNAT family N-acetyltransferase [Lachnospiraceae bacterium]